MYRRDCDHRRAAAISRAAPPDILLRLREYQRGHADGQADRRSG